MLKKSWHAGVAQKKSPVATLDVRGHGGQAEVSCRSGLFAFDAIPTYVLLLFLHDLRMCAVPLRTTYVCCHLSCVRLLGADRIV